MTPFVSIERLGKAFGANHVIDRLDLKILPNETIAFVGPSGCGKSTLLRILGGLDESYEGSVLIEGLKPKKFGRERSVGLLAQEGLLIPWRTALGNTLLPIDLLRRHSSADIEEAVRILSALGLGQRLNARPHALSGGMRQRVSIAQILITKQQLMLFDEPFAKLDEPLRWQLTMLMRVWLREACVVWVTHSIEEALAIADTIAIWYRTHSNCGYGLKLVRGLRSVDLRVNSSGIPDFSLLKTRCQEILELQISLNSNSDEILEFPVTR